MEVFKFVEYIVMCLISFSKAFRRDVCQSLANSGVWPYVECDLLECNAKSFPECLEFSQQRQGTLSKVAYFGKFNTLLTF